MDSRPSLPEKRGKLKLFLGYADGVGKTYAMLAAGCQRKEEGVDVVVAWANTHAQSDSDLLLANLESIPMRRVEQAGFATQEMDVDAVLARHPTLALVDDVVHTNAPGARHPSRYQDVEELLDHGINVYATLNIQHLESLRDVVFQITGLAVQETIPDSVFDEASVIELIDLPPDELLQRFNEGKIPLPAAIFPQAQQFFRLGNLIALRELSMRRAAGRVGNQMHAYMADRDISGPWPASERLMVCVSSHPISERLVRAGQRLANDLKAEWYVVYIETPERLRFADAYRERLGRILRLAEELGAQVISVSGRTIPEAIVEFARRQNITKIIVGKPLRPRWRELLSGSIVDEIIRLSGKIDVYVISDESGPLQKGLPESWRPHGHWVRYFYGALLVAVVTLLGMPLQGLIHPTNLVMIYLMAVIVAAIWLGRGPSMLASFLSVLAFDFFFVHPQFSLNVSDTQYLLTFFGLLATGLVISNLAGLVRDQVEASRWRETQTATLYNLSRELTVLGDLPSILNTVIKHIAQTFSRESAILLPFGPFIEGTISPHSEGSSSADAPLPIAAATSERLEVRAASPGLTMGEMEITAAAWAYEHAQPTGRGANTLPQAGMRFQPLRTARGVVGVLGVKPTDPGSFLTPEQRQFLDAYSSLAALAIERAVLAEESSRAQLATATEKLQTALLNSISHDLRTPLATITGVFSSLHEAENNLQDQVVLKKADRLDLVETGWEEARRLNRLVGNLLDMTRLESGALKLRLQPGDVQDVIGAALGRLYDRLRDHPLQTNVPADLPPVSMDFVLIEQVLINLLDNAIKYSPTGSPIEVAALPLPGLVEIRISDHGPGIPPEDLERIFGKFYRVQRKDTSQPIVGGTGLGLSICKGIIEAHGGSIQAQNNPGGGLTIDFTLPIEEEYSA